MTPRAANAWAASWWVASIAALLVGCAGCSRGSNSPTRAASQQTAAETTQSLHRGIKWLLGQQGPDGSWRSKVYGQMQGGVGDTALASYALAQLRPGQVDREQFSAAQHAARLGVRFLVSQLADADHAERRANADYPTYAAALLLLSLHSLEHPADALDKAQIARVLDYLKASQHTAAGGWLPDDSRFGGWNQTGAVAVEDARRPGNTNISVTQFALAALRAHSALDENASAAAQSFLANCQNFGAAVPAGDGGFFFTPDADDPLNKAGVDDDVRPARARSYGPPTADGLCALAACGAAVDDPRVAAAIAWLAKHNSVDVPPGFVAEDPGEASVGEGLKYYYAAALARVLRAYPGAPFAERHADIIAQLVRQQRADGSWQNANNVMREDDPLIATSLAIAALASLTAN